MFINFKVISIQTRGILKKNSRK